MVKRRWLLAIMTVAVILRVGFAYYLGDTTPPAKDETSYAVLAERLASGYGYSFPVTWYPFAQAGAPTSHWSFLYTAIIASIFSVVGAHPLAVRLIQALICGLMMPWLTYRLTQRVFPNSPHGQTLPLLAASWAAIYAYFVLYGAMVQTEALFVCVVLWSMERALVVDRALATSQPGKGLAWASLGLGISLGIAALLRQSILPWVPLLCLWLVTTGCRSGRLRSALWVSGLVIAVLAICIVPFTLRNLHVYGEFLLLNSNAGYAMFSAQHPTHGTHFQAYLAAPLPSDLTQQGLNEAQWDRALMQRGIGYVLADPRRYLLLSLSRVGSYFEFWPTSDTSLLFNLGRLVSFTLALPFMLLGIFTALKRRNSHGSRREFLLSPDPVALSLLFVVFYSLLHIFTWAMTRYRLPVDAVLLPFAALGALMANRWVERYISKKRRTGTAMDPLPDAEVPR